MARLFGKMVSKFRKKGNQVFFNILLIFIIILGIEGITRIYLYFTRGSSTVGLRERIFHLEYKPFVMFGPDFDNMLLSEKYFKNTQKEKGYRILLIGGSAAEGFPGRVLEEAFKRKFPDHSFEVINAAYGGYNARQELIVTSLWGPGLRPNMIISLDGANDLVHRLRMKRAGTFYLDESYKLIITKPYLVPFVDILRHSQFVHGLTRLKERLCVGTAEQYIDIIPVYMSAQHSINVIAKGMSSARIMVLQPFNAFKIPLSKTEMQFTPYKYREAVIKELYNLLHEQLMVLSKADGVIYIDGRQAFNGIERTIFSDDMHFVSDEGYQILADYIVSFVNDIAAK